MSQLQMKLLLKKIEKQNAKLRQRNLKLREASDTSLSQPQNGDVPKETGKGGKAKKALKHSVAVGSAEAQSASLPEETVENAKVKKSPQKLTTLANGEAAATPSPDSELKKKKKKKRKVANDSGPDTKKVKTEDSAEACKEPEDVVKKSDDSEVPRLPLGLTGAFEDTSFASLSNLVNENTLKTTEEMGFKLMTDIQHKSIMPLLEGRDLLAAAKTSSGKTLAFLTSVIELIVKFEVHAQEWNIPNSLSYQRTNWPCRPLVFLRN